ncbi:lipase 1-like [Phymastichus coffea]|uniref:lipase 1-like n=1 Tax=Phymastichus coffea TaxID=108790 RepID=UPI00273C0071|nr:lipase 1-like [Phymastichus coffea]
MIHNFSKFVILHIFFIANIACEKPLSSQLFKMTPSDKIREEGYKAEEHTVITEDGYILTMHRIPGKLGAPAIFLQHGLFSNSFDWIVMGKNKSFAFILADRGYDVWIGNARGNTYSRRHVRLNPSNPRFWNFSFHEMGIYDLPAIITYITSLKNDSIFYVGHSMGTTMSHIMAIERPDMAKKIKALFCFGPAILWKFWTSPLHVILDGPFDFEKLISKLKLFELLPQSFLTRTFIRYYCNALSENNLCLQLFFTICGRNLAQFDLNLIPLIFSHTPAGTSAKTVLHFYQFSKFKKFQKYNYKAVGNKIKYNSSEPPEYDLTKVNIPVGLFWSDNDLLVHPRDVKTVYDLLPKKVLSYRIPDPLFSHTDFIWANNAKEVLYLKVLSVMESFL